ncbi:palmitoyltransferase for Vac8p, partial [Mortierella claussenii]
MHKGDKESTPPGSAAATAAAAHPNSVGTSSPLSSAATAPAAAVVAVEGYKIHSSALAASVASSIPSAPSSSNMSALAATQRAAALASNKSNSSSGYQTNGSHSVQVADDNEPTSSASDIVRDVVQPLMPLGLALLMIYIYYVYTFRVCIRGPGSPLKPPHQSNPPPIPPTTTPFQPRRIPRLLPAESSEYNSNRSDAETTPLLQGTLTNPSSSTLGYRAAVSRGATTLDRKEGRQPIQAAKLHPELGAYTIDIGSENRTEKPVATLSISKRDGRPRWCDICSIVKPDRCHHCSECNKCVLRMDHHCPWVRGCIGYNNHKFFFLFIFYASLVALWVSATMVPLLAMALRQCEPGSPLKDDQFEAQPRCTFDLHWAIMTAFTFLLALLIVSFTGAHMIYILKNRTTIESLQDIRTTFIRVQYTKPGAGIEDTLTMSPYWSGQGFNVIKVEPGEHLWDRGSWLANWKSIMGNSCWLWFIPCGNTPGDGIHDIYNSEAYNRIVNEALVQSGVPRSGSIATVPVGRPVGTRTGATVGEAGSSQSTLIPEQEIMTAPAAPLLTTQTGVVSRSSEESGASVGSMGRSLPTPRSSPRLSP